MLKYMDAERTDIFISYRRIDGRDVARTIQLALGKEGFENVFFDYNSMREGMFNKQILTAINHCKDFVLILSPQSMLRCANQEDWVAKEIQTAIEAGCKIIPVQINEPFTQWPDNFPPRFNFIKQIEFLTLRTDEYFDASIKRLISWLDSKPNKITSKIIDNSFCLTIQCDETCELYIDGQKYRKIKGGKPALIKENFKEDNIYHFQFVSLARKGETIEIDYSRKDLLSNRDDLSISFSLIREHKKNEETEKQKNRISEKEKAREKQGMLMQACKHYDWSDLYKDGMVAVGKNGKIGFLNDNCFESVPCIYDNACGFLNGYATVCKCNKWGIINKLGQIIVPFESDFPCWQNEDPKYFVCSRNNHYAISTIAKGIPQTFPYDDVRGIVGFPELFIVKIGSFWNIINIKDDYSPFTIAVENIWGIPKSFNIVHKIENWYYPLYYPPFTVKDANTGKQGYLNSQLQLTIPFVDECSNEKTYQVNLVIIKTNKKMGLANIETGQYIIPPIYDHIMQFFWGESFLFFRVSDMGKCSKYHVDQNGKISYEDNRYIWGGQQGVIDVEGEVIVPQQYPYVDIHVHNNVPFFLAYVINDLKLTYSYSEYNYRNEKTYSLQKSFDKNKVFIHIFSSNGTLLKKIKYCDFLTVKFSDFI